MCDTPMPPETAVLIRNNSTQRVSQAMALNPCIDITVHVYTTVVTAKELFGD